MRRLTSCFQENVGSGWLNDVLKASGSLLTRLPSRIWLKALFLSLKPGENRGSRTLLSKEKGGQTEKRRRSPDRWTRMRWKQPDFCLLPELRGALPGLGQPVLLC
jgi:hypothetical protein